MRSRLNTLADRLVSMVVPKTTAGACACNGCEYEIYTRCASRCARVCRNCDCSRIIGTPSCVSAANC